MLTILLRTVIMYSILIGTLRLMGKRQLGELEISELVTTLVISEIATLPIVETGTPVMYAVIPLITILALEVLLSVVLLKFPKLKNVASARPSILIRHGVIDQKEMERIRISIDELVSEVRQTGLASPSEVDYAILEQNGKISIIPRRREQPPSASTLGLAPAENGILHILIADGTLNRHNMALLSVSEEWIRARLAEKAYAMQEVFLLGMDDGGQLYWVEKEKK
ncbi:MAG: DUF421 domain-containing protein [Clostridia bacterium]|nr:DUF421 domain-containing protein [Clostridia bacterium]